MKALVHLFPTETRFNFLKLGPFFMVLSLVLVLVSLGSLAVRGMNYGIDFAGGILIEVRYPQGADVGAVRSQLDGLDIGEVAISRIGTAGTDLSIRVQAPKGGEAEQKLVLDRIRETLGNVEYLQVESVGPKVGDELIEDSIWAISLALLAIAAYVWFRFEWQFAVGGLLALIHDVVVTAGLFSVVGFEFTLPIVAALLTIAGYSINDTVVIYDRVREILRRRKDLELPEVLNLALNSTLSRTILTSATTLVAVLAIFLFGGDVLRTFSFALLWGILIGTYSTLFVAVPLLIKLELKREALLLDEEGTGGFDPTEEIPEQFRAASTKPDDPEPAAPTPVAPAASTPNRTGGGKGKRSGGGRR